MDIGLAIEDFLDLHPELCNRIENGSLMAAATAPVFGYTAYRTLDSFCLPKSFGKIALWTTGLSILSGIIWACFPQAKKTSSADSERIMLEQYAKVKGSLIEEAAFAFRNQQEDRIYKNRVKDRVETTQMQFTDYLLTPQGQRVPVYEHVYEDDPRYTPYQNWEEEDVEEYLEEVWGERWDKEEHTLLDFKGPTREYDYGNAWDGWGTSPSNKGSRSTSTNTKFRNLSDVEIFRRAANNARPQGNKHLTTKQEAVDDIPFDLSSELDRSSSPRTNKPVNTGTITPPVKMPGNYNARQDLIDFFADIKRKNPNASTGRQITPSEEVKADLRVKAGDPTQDPDFTNTPLDAVVICKGRDNPEALEDDDDDDLGDDDPAYIKEMNRFMSPPITTKDEDGISIIQRTAMPPKKVDEDEAWQHEWLEGEAILGFDKGSAVATFQDGTPLPPITEMWKIDIVSLQKESLPEAIRYGAYDHYFDDKKYDEWNSMFPHRLENEMNRPNRSRDQEVIDRYRALHVPPIVEPRGRANEKAAYNLIKLEFNQQRLAIAGSHLDSEDVDDYMTDELFSVYRQIAPPPLEADPWTKYYQHDDYTVFQMLNLEWSERYNLLLNLIDNLRGYDYGNEE